MTTPEHIRHRQQVSIGLGLMNLLALMVVIVVQFAVINPQFATTRSGLCALRGDLQARVANTQQFLAHPDDYPQFNDPRTLALIRTQVEGQQRTIDALSVIGC
jgi:hypothetical protein